MPNLTPINLLRIILSDDKLWLFGLCFKRQSRQFHLLVLLFWAKKKKVREKRTNGFSIAYRYSSFNLQTAKDSFNILRHYPKWAQSWWSTIKKLPRHQVHTEISTPYLITKKPRISVTLLGKGLSSLCHCHITNITIHQERPELATCHSPRVSVVSPTRMSGTCQFVD